MSTRRAVSVSPVVALCALLVSGCSGLAGGQAEYYLEVKDSRSKTHTLTGESVACQVITSLPAGDKRQGKYSVGVKYNAGPELLFMTLHFLEHTDAPPEGTYTFGSELDVGFEFSADGETYEPPSSRDFSGAGVVVTGTAPDLKVSFDGNWPGVSGFMQCGSE